ATTAAFLAQHSNSLSQADLRARPHGRIDALQVAVTMVPATLVEQINDIVTRLHRAVVVAGQNLFSGRDHAPRRGRDDLYPSLGSAGVESVMVVDFFRARHFSAIDERLLI